MFKVTTTFLQDIFIYPIKSLGGISLDSSLTEERGLPFDRRWLLVDNKNAFLTQRKHNQMALLKVSLGNDFLEVKHLNDVMPPLKIPFNFQSYDRKVVTVFDDEVFAPVISDPQIEKWFSEILGEKVKLVFMDALAKRPIDPNFAKYGEEVSFSDGYPYLITNQASLEDLNRKLGQPVTMDRFRPNLVVSGTQPYEEDNWKQITIGTAIFDVVKSCGRCKITTINQNTAEKGKEPLDTLSTYRKFNNKIIFGQNLILKKSGRINIEDEVKIEYK